MRKKNRVPPLGSVSTKVWDRAVIELATPGSAVRLASVDQIKAHLFCTGFSSHLHGKRNRNNPVLIAVLSVIASCFVCLVCGLISQSTAMVMSRLLVS